MNITTYIATNGIQRCLCNNVTKQAHRVLSKVTSKLESNNFVRFVNTTPTIQGFAAAARQTTSLSQPAIKEEVEEEINDICEEKVLFRGSEFEFPCLNQRLNGGPEPAYQKVVDGFKLFSYKNPFHLHYNGGILPEINIAYETWGKLNTSKTNAVILFTGLSASSHAASHKNNKQPGWWEKFIGPGLALDTNKFFVICCNQLGGCYGSTGPSSINPLTGKHYGTNFPMLSIRDMVVAQNLVIESLGIKKLYASVGSSLGGMCSVLMSALFPEKVERVVSISACLESQPSSIALRYLQRRCIMEDPNWNYGNYYNREYPYKGMQLAREVATLTYRSGPEWEIRFGRKRVPNEPPSLCQNFEIEQYINYQGLTFARKYDPNSLLYISKAMDLYDLNDFASLSNVKVPTLVMGAKTDILFPIQQQRKMAQKLKETGNNSVTFYELDSLFGHDTFLLDLSGVGTAVKGFLETDLVCRNGNDVRNCKVPERPVDNDAQHRQG